MIEFNNNFEISIWTNYFLVFKWVQHIVNLFLEECFSLVKGDNEEDMPNFTEEFMT